MFQEYHNEAPDGLLRTTGVVAGLVSKIKAKFPTFEFPKKIEQFALSRTCFRMRAISRKLAADRAETLKAKRKVLDFIYSSEPSKKGKKVSKVLFLQICLFENSSFYVRAYRGAACAPRLGMTTITRQHAAATLYFQNQGKTWVLPVLPGMAPLLKSSTVYLDKQKSFVS